MGFSHLMHWSVLALLEAKDFTPGVRLALETRLQTTGQLLSHLRRIIVIALGRTVPRACPANFHNNFRPAAILLQLHVLESRDALGHEHGVISQQVDHETEEEDVKENSDCVEHYELHRVDKTAAQVHLVACECDDAEDNLEEERSSHENQHSQEQNVVETPDIIAHPAAMMIEISAASIAHRAMLTVFDYKRLANVAVETCLVGDKVFSALEIFLGAAEGANVGHSWICGVTLGDKDCREDHSSEAENVETCEEAQTESPFSQQRILVEMHEDGQNERAEGKCSEDPCADLCDAGRAVKAILAHVFLLRLNCTVMPR
mmetsp:Transcript_7417/g.8595  ORF Transcript_7417/g.8595 Transcript_7417/m.8595 type:complete len:318 (-) Transcript_7417:70-1023(-)|eukprot:CAMPEP_0185615090 /NCGR_PEP_ID=MMETSP0436-20130131/34389_1 /TAXON_ID=626734 ORGANISM="Favella taraikaensis, Strain Fe Narragansett Bay" /NCGR_SAMPLE_ID=MMETSP0436 /ASSEMBLY_ACC=CAM_ASM_000390 /LENGTH=317 /DNA_ID=CAMNT_0028250487 /DNA_START=240 /DNA_END=1193 /DNA_ORIENTATION=+